MKKILTKIIIMLLSALILFYLMLPSLNIHDYRFYLFILFMLIELFVLSIPESFKILKNKGFKAFFKSSSASIIAKITFVLICLSLLYYLITTTFFTPLFMAKEYANRIKVEEVEFSEVPPYDFNTTAIIDRRSAEKLGDKVMGEMTDLVSQFTVSEEYSQISYNNGTYRVTPLAYDGLIKYVRNRFNGIPGYIIVNTTTGNTQLVRLDEAMRYVPSAYLFDNLYRRIRFMYPFEIFGDPTFEIDEAGNPYYVCTTYTYRGVNNLKKVTGVILFNPVDGTGEKYSTDNIPNWVDRVYPETLVTNELDDYGMYQKGYVNSFFGQEGVIQTSEGYNYISKNGDIWLYTGMTSAIADESNVGFMLVNLRTHEAEYIKTSGADEYSVMDSAEGEVSDYGYTATFPILINIDDKPVYILSLKDSAGLVKMYAMVDAQDYQQVYTIKAEKDAKTAIDTLIEQITGKKPVEEETISEFLEDTITIEDMKEVIIEGNTHYYIFAGGRIYVIIMNEAIAPKVIFTSIGDTIGIKYYESNGTCYITEIK